MVRPKDAVLDIGNGQTVGEFQADVMKSAFHLAGLHQTVLPTRADHLPPVW